MNRLNLFLTCSLFLLGSSIYGQTWGCPEKDYRCQLDVWTKALQTDPKNPENYYHLGIVLQRSGAHKEAIETFSMYLVIPGVKPEFQADGYNNRGISQRALRRPELAYADYTTAIELNPKKPEFLVNRGNASADMKKVDQAFEDYQRAITLDPKYGQTYAQRGILYVGQARIDDALRDFAKSIELDPRYAEPYYNRGTINFQRKEWARAIPDFDKYVGLVENPNYLADGFMNRGICHYYTGNKKKALEDFSKVIEIQPKQPKAYQARAMLYREMKKDDLAAADERKAAGLAAAPK